MVETSGNFETIKPQDLFNEILASNKPGMLTITRYQQIRTIMLTRTSIGIDNQGIGAVTQLGAILLARGYISDNELEKGLQSQREDIEGKRIGEILVEKKYITPEQLKEVLEYQFIEQILEIMTWRDATYEYTQENFDELQQQFQGVTLNQAPTKVVALAVRGMSEWPKLERRLPSPWLVFRHTPKISERLKDAPPEERRIIHYIQENRTLETIVQNTGVGRISVYKIVIQLLDNGFILPAPIDDMKFMASDHRSRKRYVDALNIYRRLLQVTSKQSDRRELEKLIYETIDAIEVAKFARTSESDASQRIHRRAKIARNRRMVKQYSKWALLGSLLLFFFVFFVLMKSSRIKKTMHQPALPSESPAQKQNSASRSQHALRIPDSLKSFHERVLLDIADGDYSAAYTALTKQYTAPSIASDAKQKSALETILNDTLQQHRDRISKRLSVELSAILTDSPDPAVFLTAFQKTLRKKISPAFFKQDELKRRAILTALLANTPENDVYNLFIASLPMLSVRQLEHAMRLGGYELAKTEAERRALMEAFRLFKRDMSSFDTSLSFNRRLLQVQLKDNTGQFIEARRISHSDFMANHWRSVANTINRMQYPAALRQMQSLVTQVKNVIAEADRARDQTKAPGMETAESLYRRALAMTAVSPNDLPPDIARRKAYQSLAKKLSALSQTARSRIQNIDTVRAASRDGLAKAIRFEAIGENAEAVTEYESIINAWPDAYTRSAEAFPDHWAAIAFQRLQDVQPRFKHAEALLKQARSLDPKTAGHATSNPRDAYLKYFELALKYGDILNNYSEPGPSGDTTRKRVQERINALSEIIAEFRKYIDAYSRKIDGIRNDLATVSPGNKFAFKRVERNINDALGDLENMLNSSENAKNYLIAVAVSIPIRVESRPIGSHIFYRQADNKKTEARWIDAGMVTPGYIIVPFGKPLDITVRRDGWRAQVIRFDDFIRPSACRATILTTPIPTSRLSLKRRETTCRISARPEELDDATLMFPTENGVMFRVKIQSPDTIGVMAQYPLPTAIGPMFQPVLFETSKGKLLVVATRNSMDFLDIDTGQAVKWRDWSKPASRLRQLGNAMIRPVVYESYSHSGTPYVAWVTRNGAIAVSGITPGSAISGKPLTITPAPRAGGGRPIPLAPVRLFPIGNDKLMGFSASREKLAVVKRTNPSPADTTLINVGGTVLWPDEQISSGVRTGTLFGAICFEPLPGENTAGATRYLAALSQEMKRKIVLVDVREDRVTEQAKWEPIRNSTSIESVHLVTTLDGEKSAAVVFGKNDNEKNTDDKTASNWRSEKDAYWIMLLDIIDRRQLIQDWTSPYTIFGRPLPPVSGKMFGQNVIYVVTQHGRLYIFSRDTSADALLVDGEVSDDRTVTVKYAFSAPGGGLGVVMENDEVLFFYEE